MLVLCVGMYRACSTWQYGVAGSILERHRGVERLGFLDGGPFGSDVEPGLDPSAWQILKAHDAHERFALALAQGRALAIYAHRDLRDVALSWAHKVGVGLDEVLEGGFLDLCLANDRFWRGQPGTLLQSFEGLVADPVGGVREIAAHLGVELLEGEAESIASAHSIEANRKRAEDLSARLRAEGREPSPKDQDSYDRESLLHWNHLRDGRAGGWRDHATPEQRRALARACGPWLVERGYEPDDAWADLEEPEARAIPRVSYAQNMEDILLDRLFPDRTGTYIDVGANHPTHNNNTYFFYLRGWRGVNIEPVPSALAEFEASRPRDWNLSVAASDEAGELPFFEVPECTGLSSLSPEAAQEQRDRGFRVVERRIPTRTIADLVDEHGWVPPEIFSIDVEGNEERVLRGIPLDRWQPQVFVIEATRPMTNVPCHESWEPLLLGRGYLFAAFDGINRYYLRGDLADRLPLLEYPVNSLDFYERADAVEQRARADELARLRSEEHARAEEHRAYLEHELAHFRQDSAHFRKEAEYLAAARTEDRANALDGLARERASWQQERDAWQRERDAIQRERDARQVERDSVQVERDAVQRERDSIQRDRDAFQSERDAYQRERDAFQGERDAFQRERDSVRDEREAAQRDRDARSADRDARQADREAWLVERGDWLTERARLQAEADRANRLTENLGDELNRLHLALAREEAEVQELRRALQADRESLGAEIARLHAERAELDRSAAEAAIVHPPHRLIDRLRGSAFRRKADRPRSNRNS